MSYSNTLRFSLCAILTAACAPALAAEPLRVSDYGDLQAAIDSASPGDTIVVDIETLGAIVDKPLTIQGAPGGLVRSVKRLPFYHPLGLGLTHEASGSSILDLTVTGVYGIVADLLGPVNDVTIRGCTISAENAGIFLIPTGGSGWTIEHNSIEILPGYNREGTEAVAISLHHVSDVRVAHNRIFGVRVAPYFVAVSGGVVVIGGDNIQIVHNEIAVSGDGGPLREVLEGVLLLSGPGTLLSDITVAMNDLSGCMTPDQLHAISYVGTLDEHSDVTGLAAFDQSEWESPPAVGLVIGGNLDPLIDRRGDGLAGSKVPIGPYLRP